jgi:hypothetical protein
MSPFDIIIGVVALATLILMIKNLGVSGLTNMIPRKRECGTDEIIIEGRILKPIIFVGELPSFPPDKNLGSRIAAAIRHSGLNASLAYTLLRADKPRLLKRLEKEIERARLAYEATKNPKYGEKLGLLEKLYSDIVKSTRPYTGSALLIVWVDENTSPEEAKALKTLIEAETGVEFRRLESSIAEALVHPGSLALSRNVGIPIPWVEDYKEDSIVLGASPEYNALVTLSWPEDFETHIGIIGPTGKGKTVLMLGMIVQLASSTMLRDKPTIFVLDPKGDVKSLLSRTSISFKEFGAGELVEDLCNTRGIHILSNPDPSLGKRMIENCWNATLRGDHTTEL